MRVLLMIGAVVFLAGCAFGSPTTFQPCEFVKDQAEANALTKAWGSLKKNGAMIAFATNRGILSTVEAAKATVNPDTGWPVGLKERVAACIKS